MKKVILYIIALSLPLALAGCLDNFHKDEIENISRTVTVKLIPPEGFENESFEGVTVQFSNSTRGVVYNVKADANNTVTVDVEVGI